MEPGDLVEFFEEKRLLCGVILELKGERLHVLTQNSRELTLAPKRVLHAGPKITLASSRQELLAQLGDTARKREDLKAAINLEELWELLAAEEQAATVAELADLWFGQTSPDQVAAMARKLREDRFLFKVKDGLAVPNAPEAVQQLQEQHLQELERRRELEEIVAWLQAVWEGKKLAAAPAWRPRVEESLRQLVIWGPEAPDYAQGKAYLDAAGLNNPQAPFRLLVRLGVFQEDEDLDLYRLEVPLEFPDAALDLARRLSASLPPDPYAACRHDLTHLETLTIDGERTRDYDDALSLEDLPEGGWRLGIHIADVSSLVQSRTPLDQEAMVRGTSIYLPERRLPMFPEEISEDVLSLVAHQERLALSFLVNLGPGAEIRDWVIVPARIRVARRLTYHEVDDLLPGDEELAALSRLTRRLRERRLDQGGYELRLPEVWVNFAPSGELQVVVEDQETLSRQLVAEAMVLANSLAARWLAEQGVPAIFRAQPEPREEIQPLEEKSLLDLWRDRRRLSRVVMDLKPAPHWGLGLPCYTFATSPIRRYLDLVTHRQLQALAAGAAPAYGAEELARILAQIGPAMRRAGLLKARRLRYWLLKYLAGKVGQKLEALVLESLPHRYRLMFPDLQLEFFFTAPASLRLAPGDTLLVRLDRVLPREDQVKVSLA